MDAYIELVNNLAAEKSEDIVNNSSAEHAIALFTAMFNHGSPGEARILSGGLNRLIYANESVIEAITNFLSRDGNTLSVVIQGLDGDCKNLVEDKDIKSNPLIEKLREKFVGNFENKVSVKRATGNLKDLSFHFTTVGKALRFEPDRTKKEAFASFNRPTMVDTLNKLWNDGISHATPVAI